MKVVEKKVISYDIELTEEERNAVFTVIDILTECATQEVEFGTENDYGEFYFEPDNFEDIVEKLSLFMSSEEVKYTV